MLLKYISIKNYRCFEDLQIPLARLTAFIGANDVGKSSILHLIRHCLENDPIPKTDFRDKNKPITVDLAFEVNRDSEAAAAQRFMRSDRELLVRKTFSAEGGRPQTSVYRTCYVDDRLDRLETLRAPDLNSVMQELGITQQCTRNEERINAIRQYLAENPVDMHEAWIPVGSDLDSILPEFIMFGAAEDLTLDSGPLAKTLRRVFTSFLSSQEEQLNMLQVAARTRLMEEVEGLKPLLSQFTGRVSDLDVDPRLDFSKSLAFGEFSVKMSDGQTVPFSRCGDGTKRRIVAAVFSWSHKVNERIDREEGRSLIWGFDEPDTHLHYEAQYRLVAHLKEMAKGGVQVLLCTHSIPTIDRLPATAIRHLVWNVEKLETKVEYLDEKLEDGEDVVEFLQSVGRGVGFPNSLLFYERCFIIVEGGTEEKSLPIMYRRLYDTELLDDGIRIFAAESSGAAIRLAQFLHKQRRQVLLLLDSDTKGKLQNQLEELEEIGFNIQDRVLFVGTVEFEDSLPDDAVLAVLNRHHPRKDKTAWNSDHIRPFRNDLARGAQIKFSEEFLKKVVGPQSGVGVSKPEFGRRVAEIIDLGSIPQEIRTLFQKARDVAGT